MGLMDKVKAQATQLAQKTQEAAQEGRARLDQAQAGRRADTLLRQLGVAVFADRTGRGAADSQAKIDKLISDLSAHERDNGVNLVEQAQSFPPQPNFPPDPASPYPGPAASPFPGGGPAPTSFPDPAATSFPDSGGVPGPPAGGAPHIDTTTSFFPGPGDPASDPGSTGFPPES